MTEHDRIRAEQGDSVLFSIRCSEPVSDEELAGAVRGLQSTDDPSLTLLHDELIAILEQRRQ